MTAPRVLFDGWPLAYAPDSPAALHLLALLDALDDGADALVALPAASCYPLTVKTRLAPMENTPFGRLAWEQWSLTALVVAMRAQILHLAGAHPPLDARVPTVVSPAEAPAGWPMGSVAERLRAAASRKLKDSTALLWPQDLPAPQHAGQVLTLPPLAGLPAGGDPYPEAGYVLGLLADDPAGLRALLAGWAWASGPVGEVAPLLLAGLSDTQRAEVERLVQEGDFGETVRFAPSHPDWRALYRDAALVVRTGAALPWGDPVTYALAAGKAVVAEEDADTGARVGSAAYLTPPGDDRALGAALVTLVVEGEMADALGEAAAQRAAQWPRADFGARLAEAYQALAG